MQNRTRELFTAYLTQLQQLNGVADATHKFTVAPTVQQTLERKIQESSAFLSSINVMPVNEQEGEKLGLGVGGPIAGTTDTTKQDRVTTDPGTVDAQNYRCEQTNYDTHITYAKMDAWAKFPNFQTLLRDAIVQRCALDRIMIGFNGVKRAATSDKATNPLLQDVNVGWLQHYRNTAPQRVLDHGKVEGKVTLGVDGDYANLDALVFDAVSSLLEPWYSEDTQLVVICGRKLLHDKYFPIVNATQPPTERIAADLIMSQKRIGNLPAVRVPSFPPNALMVTRLDNLSIYYQEGARRRSIVDNAKRDRVENYESSNDAYVVEDFGAGCVVENIALAATAAQQAG
ncbi:phage major capsid protein, P2 family [Paraburkholderia sp. A1RI_3L]|uniref:phage major capsid protein, P2 family n=1 Tax=Paraburkholderia TaxID=1822464 RepID=UPI003B7ACFBB